MKNPKTSTFFSLLNAFTKSATNKTNKNQRATDFLKHTKRSAIMSLVTRRKHVIKEMMADDYELPTEQQQIVRVVSSRGNNLHQVEASDPTSENFLVSMPTKFRNTMWVKRGNFVLVEPIEEGDKVKAEICKILTPDHIKEYAKAGVWPKRFTKNREIVEVEPLDSDEEENGIIVRNLNRPQPPIAAESDNDDSSSSDESRAGRSSAY